MTRSSSRSGWTSISLRRSITELDRRSVIALIESIEIIGKEDLRIKFRYGLEYEAALKLLAERKAAPVPLMALYPSLMAITKEAV